MNTRTYPNENAFRQALDQRLRNLAGGGGAKLERHRQAVVFERFLARVAAEFGDSVILKGGLVMELRIARARATRDVDLRITGAPEQLLARLQSAAGRPFDDFLSYTVDLDPDHPKITTAGMVYEGQRFRAEGRIGSRIYGQPFGVDVGFGDPLVGKVETKLAPDLLGFAGIAPPVLRLYPIESHIAEKLHAYTLPRQQPNSRVKDLPDIALLASAQPIDGALLREAMAMTFGARKTHPLPKMLPDPSTTWREPYEQMARDDDLPWPTLVAVTAAARAFLDPLLAGGGTRWDPQGWCWVEN